MPTYEYRCRACALRFEIRQSIVASPRTRCPRCGKKMDRLISAGAGFLFKGSGFYTTDHRSEPYQAAAKRDRKGGSQAPATETVPPKDGTGPKMGAGPEISR
jgi:putative FmdB family regulatory protein